MRSNSPARAEGVLSVVVVWRAAHGLIATGFLVAIGYVGLASDPAPPTEAIILRSAD